MSKYDRIVDCVESRNQHYIHVFDKNLNGKKVEIVIYNSGKPSMTLIQELEGMRTWVEGQASLLDGESNCWDKEDYNFRKLLELYDLIFN